MYRGVFSSIHQPCVAPMVSPATTKSLKRLHSFLLRRRPKSETRTSAVSLFSGGGLSDFGYAQAGFEFHVQAEIDRLRAGIGKRNFPQSRWLVDDVRKHADQVVQTYRVKGEKVDCLVATPPCQGMSTSNPSRGKRNSKEARVHSRKNALVLGAVPIIEALKPRLFVIENVRQFLTHSLTVNRRRLCVPDALRALLPNYQVFSGLVNVADYGVPQIRLRAVIVGIHESEACLSHFETGELLPWPKPSHSSDGVIGTKWVTLRQWLRFMKYQELDSSSAEKARGNDPLHNVPHYDSDRYCLVSSIPRFSGQSAYENDRCPSCDESGIELSEAICPSCGEPMKSRPLVINSDGSARLIKGFASSYRRMSPDRPSATITTNSSHVGSDFKIHPWENRVLSALECADLQTVPRYYDWSPALKGRMPYLVRQLIGESFPPYFTYLHGKIIRQLLCDDPRVSNALQQCG